MQIVNLVPAHVCLGHICDLMECTSKQRKVKFKKNVVINCDVENCEPMTLRRNAQCNLIILYVCEFFHC